MSVIKPFRGLRPRPEHAAQVAAPPYDVLSSDEARELVRNNPLSFLRVNKSEVDFPPDTSAYSKEVYQRGRENLQRLIDDGIMCRDDQPSFYLYRLTWQNRSQTGLVALCSCEEYDRNKIKKHEHTRPAKVNDRADHIQTVKAQVGPVLSIFQSNSEVKAVFDKIRSSQPVYDFVDDAGVRHELWVVSDAEQIERLTTLFDKMESIYIADGHHRSAAASEVARRLKVANSNHRGDEHYNYFLNVIFPDNELRILSYNRVVTDLNGMTPDEFVSKLEARFNVGGTSQAVLPQDPLDVGMLVDGRWYRLTAKEGTFDRDDPVESIGSAILTANLLQPVLGIADVRTDDRIDFVGGIRGVRELEKLVKSGQFAVAFAMYPVTVEQLLAVADAGEVMPPKSTWFEPKLRSGMVVNLLDE